MAKQRCVDCHFFMETTHSVDKEGELLEFEDSVDQEDRKAVLKNNFEWEVESRSLRCYFKVWIEGYSVRGKSKYQILVETERKNNCFFDLF